MDIFGKAGVPCSLVQTVGEVVKDPQVVARGSLIPVEGFEGLFGVRSPFRLGSVPNLPDTWIPGAGSHTVEILHEIGFEAARIRELVEENTVQTKEGRVPADV